MQVLLELGPEGAELSDHQGLVGLRAAGHQGGRQRDAHAAADVSREVENARGVAHLFLGQAAHGGGRQGDKDAGHGHAGKNVRPHDVHRGDFQVDASEHPAGVCQEAEGRPDQQPRIDHADQRPTTIKEKIAPIPRGLMAMPLFSAG